MSRDGAISRRRDTCRVCGGEELVPFLDLGLMPLVNRYLNPAAAIQDEPRFPLEIRFCRSCSLSQLSVVVDPKILYSEYDYHSSVSRTFQHHCGEMAASLKCDLSLASRDLVVEIASNDGCLVSKFQKLGCKVLGVEPAANLARLANDAGNPTLQEFWSQAVADRIRKEHGPARLVVATNVVAHVDDLHGFIRAVAFLIQPAGAFVFEVPYMVNFMNRAEFDTAYHEHLSYFLLRPLKRALEENGLALVNAQEFEIHGGSIRVTARPAESGAVPSDTVQRLLGWEEELGLHEEASYLRFASHVAMLKEELTTFVHALKARGKKLAAYGASAKGNVLLNYCGIGKDMLEYVVDDTPAKQGKLYPGNHLPIVSRDRLNASPPDYLLLLAWNFVDEMVQNTAEYRARGGRYIVPIPSLRVI
jgi:C-methyltransferase C-terminal domain/Putative zinc binding domain/Methyltransferase domain